MKLFKLSLLVLVGILISCKADDKDQKQTSNGIEISKKQITINWMGSWYKRESKKKLVKSAAREFELLNQDIKINIKYQEEFCNGCDKAYRVTLDSIIKMIKERNFSWDIIPLTQSNYAEIATVLDDKEWGKKYLVNFEEFDWFKNNHINQVFDVSNYRSDFGGIFAGPLLEGRYTGLWYNSETAQKIGINIKNDGLNFNDFLGYCRQLNDYNKTAQHKISFFNTTRLNSLSDEIFYSLVLSEINDTINITRQNALSATLKALNALEELSKNNAVDNSIKLDDKNDPVLYGNALFSVEVSSYYNQWETMNSKNALKMVPVELPTFKESNLLYHGSFQSVWAVFKDSPHSKEAVELMKFICTNDFAERWINSTHNPTGLKVRLDVTDFGKNKIDIFNKSIEKQYGDNIRNFEIEKILFGNDTKIEIDVTPVIKGNQSAQDYYNSIVKQLK